MSTTQTLRGFTTISYWAADLEAAKRWYTELLGIEPYFHRPGYYEFRIGDYQHELGILDRRFAPAGTGASPITYWAVDDVEAAYERLLSLGAVPQAKPTEHGPGFVTASVVDPFGNTLGVMFNQHYLDILASRVGA